MLDMLRAHVLAGCELPAVWVPDGTTRDDRELVRAHLELSDKLVALKNQVRTLHVQMETVQEQIGELDREAARLGGQERDAEPTLLYANSTGCQGLTQ